MSRYSAMPPLAEMPTAAGLARVSATAPAWRPGLAAVRHSEVFASSREASGAAAALALAADALAADALATEKPTAGKPAAGKPAGASSALAEIADRRAVLWVQDKAALRVGGRPYRPGLPAAFRNRLIHVVANKVEDALFALEEGLRCRDLAVVIGELAGNPRALDFTASRRLTLAAERHRVPLWLVRLDAERDLSSARMRWDVAAAPSPPPRWNAAAPGIPAWRAELFRARRHPPGTWTLHDDGHGLAAARLVADRPAGPDTGAGTASPHPVGMAAAAGDRSLAAW
ncbi:hypothetical protein [Tsuneonella aeria]|uniref:hypothetical protein n=1 Tax=Tsuneonella aeria TaxID=1837929 RepID=UPI001F27C099|nr:hypothetical protein [Tsuneonella aeria]